MCLRVQRNHWRRLEHVAKAALASGRVLLTEFAYQSTSTPQPSTKQKPKEAARAYNTREDEEEDYSDDEDYYDNEEERDWMDEDDDENDMYASSWDPPTHDDLRWQEKQKAQAALLESLQVDALWKICKIDLDRIICEACDLVLEDPLLLFGAPPPTAPSASDSSYAPYSGLDNPWSSSTSSSLLQPQSQQHSQDGWVGMTGNAVTTHYARMRAAAALALMGDVMVQRSKEGTAWME